MLYRAKNESVPRHYLTHTYGAFSGKPLEDTTMKGLAYSIAYLYRRHAVLLYESEDGRSFKKADEKMQSEFSRIMNDEFTYREAH